ncbi:hypothetical protein TNCV_3661361 [Trichonephila clavipes]|nr:hypothetical protein TNCV_3661361 [Trichonephila clavipes]
MTKGVDYQMISFHNSWLLECSVENSQMSILLLSWTSSDMVSLVIWLNSKWNIVENKSTPVRNIPNRMNPKPKKRTWWRIKARGSLLNVLHKLSSRLQSHRLIVIAVTGVPITFWIVDKEASVADLMIVLPFPAIVALGRLLLSFDAL